MNKYYTRACNFYYGKTSKKILKEKSSIPLNGNNLISFDKIEILTRKGSKLVDIKYINKLPNNLKLKISKDIKQLQKEIPLGRLSNSEEIVNLVLFLSSNKNTYITGQSFIIDGGFVVK